ncbi:Bgt-5186 [Blumeria graminis f. sp. tritici]|uniref:Bgt-5186 n=2 Tax=Blumeria graminis f. sp. tritici TaxID=62690 RepID=A0A381LEX0_BLUGR|nr:hypothetical protein BGT96224_5186 [Blumeria graminis f. sp. tritici 96224]VDB93232.1 Bgt-5186 [Blumeria graminis f. sp. tritici]
MAMQPFAEVLDLEQQFYEEGYQQGVADGERAGLDEGRTLGLEKGFEKFAESGRLYGKSLIWANRIAHTNIHTNQVAAEQPTKLMPLPNNKRIVTHVRVLHALVEAETLSVQNSEEAVSDFDDRLNRARAKAKIIERLIHSAQMRQGSVEKPDPECVIRLKENVLPVPPALDQKV